LKILKKDYNMSKKASFEMSIGHIVALILAITFLGLGLAFINNVFGSASEQFKEVGGAVKKQMIDQMKKTNKEVDLSSTVYKINPGKKGQIFVGFKNTEQDSKKFIIKGAHVSSLSTNDANC